MTYDYASVGFYTFDCLGRPVDAIPEGGGTLFIEELTLAVSGAAGSAAIAAAKYGLNVLAVGGVGEDDMGDWVLQKLQNFGVDVSGMMRCPGVSTSSSIVTTRSDGTRPALHKKGATGAFSIDEVLEEKVLDTRILHLGGAGLIDRMDGEPNAKLFRHAREKGITTTLDVFASTERDLPLVAQLLPHTDYFIPSIEEAQALSGIADMEDATSFFLDRGVGCCVFTLGNKGAYYRHANGERFLVPAFNVDVVCTCGCGDVFNAGFAAGLSYGYDAETCVRIAQATSALNATGLGSQAGVSDFASTLEFMASIPTR